jgi:hypothetical protein
MKVKGKHQRSRKEQQVRKDITQKTTNLSRNEEEEL